MLAIKNPARTVSLLASAAGLLFLAGCTASGPRSLIDGEAALRSGNYARAVDKLKKATELLPDEPRAWNLLGLAYHQSSQPRLAGQAYRRAMDRDRSNLVSVAHFNLGCLLLENGDASAAANELRSFTMISNSAIAWVKLGQAQLRLRQYDSAERSLATAIHLDRTNAEAYNDLGLVYFHRSRGRDAIQYVNAALQLNPKYPPAILNAAILAQQSASTRSMALQRFREYLTLQPRPADYQAVAALVSQLEADLAPRATPQTNATAAPVPAVRATNAAAATLMTNTGPPSVTSSVAHVSMPVTNPPSHLPSPSLSELHAAAVSTSTPPAIAAAAPVSAPPRTSVPPSHVPTNALQTNVPVTVVDVTPPPAVQVATSAPVRQPAPSVADTAATKQAPPPAESVPPPAAVPTIAVTGGVNTGAAKSDKPSLLARLNPFRSKPDKAPVATGTVVVVNPGVTSRPAAVEAMTAAAKTFPRYQYTRPTAPPAGDRAAAQRAFQLAMNAQTAGNAAEAARQFDLAVAADPSYFDAQYNRAVVAMRTDAARSLPLWEKALAADPDSASGRHSFALALKQAGYVQDAAAELEKILETRPAEVRAHLTLANICAQQLGDVRRAKEHYLKVIELDPRNPQAPAIRFWLAANP